MGKNITKYTDLTIDYTKAKVIEEIKLFLDKNDDYEDKELDNILEGLAFIVSTGYMKRICGKYNNGHYNEGDTRNGFLGRCATFLKRRGIQNYEDILLKIENLDYLVDCTTDKVPKSEIYANIMILANATAHILGNVVHEKERLKQEGINLKDAIKSCIN